MIWVFFLAFMAETRLEFLSYLLQTKILQGVRYEYPRDHERN